MRDLAAIYRKHFFVETVQVSNDLLIIGHTFLAGADSNKVFVHRCKINPEKFNIYFGVIGMNYNFVCRHEILQVTYDEISSSIIKYVPNLLIYAHSKT
jgi:hypothetical protein